jgi:hypothetical protein
MFYFSINKIRQKWAKHLTTKLEFVLFLSAYEFHHDERNDEISNVEFTTKEWNFRNEWTGFCFCYCFSVIWQQQGRG